MKKLIIVGTGPFAEIAKLYFENYGRYKVSAFSVEEKFIDKKTFSKDSFDSTEVNDDIQIIQIALEYLDFLESKIYETGIYDEETEIAVEEFQKKYNLNVTGELKEVDLRFRLQ